MILTIPRTLWLAFETHSKDTRKDSVASSQVVAVSGVTPQYPPLQLPVNLFFRNNVGQEFEARIYDMDELRGLKFLVKRDPNKPKRIKHPRARVFVRITKVPDNNSTYASIRGALFSNLSQALSSCQQGGSSASGWVAWNVKYENRLVSIGRFRQTESTGSGFLQTPNWTPIIRNVMGHYAIPNQIDHIPFANTHLILE